MQHRQHVLHRFKSGEPGGGGFGKDDMGCGGSELFKRLYRSNVAIQNGGFAKRACHRQNIARQFRPANINQNGIKGGNILRRAGAFFLMQSVIVKRHDQPFSPVIDDDRRQGRACAGCNRHA